MKKRNKLKIWEVLTEAKKLLSDDKVHLAHCTVKYEYICHCISAVYKTDIYDVKKRNTPAHHLIKNRLSNKTDIREWLDDNVPNWYNSVIALNLNSRQQIQAYRHRWLDALIKEFKEKDL